MVPGHQPQRQSPSVLAEIDEYMAHVTQEKKTSCYAQAFTHGKVVMFDSNSAQYLHAFAAVSLLPSPDYVHAFLLYD